MEMFILTISVLNTDSGLCDTYVLGAYDSFEKAQERMSEEVAKAREEFAGIEHNEASYAHEDTSWGIWEKGQYMSNHLELEIHPQKIS